ncbi:MAG TPA: hypothetical protein VHJ20_10235 [Polyangia bacterium]|nr:hypothetical protein [Polyangia bacterium]
MRLSTRPKRKSRGAKEFPGGEVLNSLPANRASMSRFALSFAAAARPEGGAMASRRVDNHLRPPGTPFPGEATFSELFAQAADLFPTRRSSSQSCKRSSDLTPSLIFDTILGLAADDEISEKEDARCLARGDVAV